MRVSRSAKAVPASKFRIPPVMVHAFRHPPFRQSGLYPVLHRYVPSFLYMFPMMTLFLLFRLYFQDSHV